MASTERNLLGSTNRSFVTGEVSGSATAKQLPSVAGVAFYIQARASNAGKVYVGISGVAKPTGVTNTNTGWELSAGESMPVLFVDNLNQLYIIGENATDHIIYRVDQ